MHRRPTAKSRGGKQRRGCRRRRGSGRTRGGGVGARQTTRDAGMKLGGSAGGGGRSCCGGGCCCLHSAGDRAAGGGEGYTHVSFFFIESNEKCVGWPAQQRRARRNSVAGGRDFMPTLERITQSHSTHTLPSRFRISRTQEEISTSDWLTSCPRNRKWGHVTGRDDVQNSVNILVTHDQTHFLPP